MLSFFSQNFEFLEKNGKGRILRGIEKKANSTEKTVALFMFR